MAVTAAIQHHVKDYDAWREVYDGFADVQNANGVTDQSVHRSKDDGNDLWSSIASRTWTTQRRSLLSRSFPRPCSAEVSRGNQ